MHNGRQDRLQELRRWSIATKSGTGQAEIPKLGKDRLPNPWNEGKWLKGHVALDRVIWSMKKV